MSRRNTHFAGNEFKCLDWIPCKMTNVKYNYFLHPLSIDENLIVYTNPTGIREKTHCPWNLWYKSRCQHLPHLLHLIKLEHCNLFLMRTESDLPPTSHNFHEGCRFLAAILFQPLSRCWRSRHVLRHLITLHKHHSLAYDYDYTSQYTYAFTNCVDGFSTFQNLGKFLTLDSPRSRKLCPKKLQPKSVVVFLINLICVTKWL